jgi:DMATS type aromatic prenyltransferase
MVLKLLQPLKQQIQYLTLYRDVLVPALGPKPTKDKPHFHSFCNDDGSPLELSWNFWKGGSTVRICLEPIGELAGRSEDPFNQLATCALALELSRMPNVSLSWFDYIRERFFVAKEDASNIYLLERVCTGTALPVTAALI